MIEKLLKNWQDKQDSQMVAYLTEETLNIIKEHTSIPEDIEVKIIPQKVVLDGKCEENVAFIIPTGDKPLKVAFEKINKDNKIC